MAKQRRVVQWSTGGVGAIAVRVLSERPDFDLAGVWVHNPDKVDRDAGEIAGGTPIGVKASSNQVKYLCRRSLEGLLSAA